MTSAGRSVPVVFIYRRTEGAAVGRGRIELNAGQSAHAGRRASFAIDIPTDDRRRRVGRNYDPVVVDPSLVSRQSVVAHGTVATRRGRNTTTSFAR